MGEIMIKLDYNWEIHPDTYGYELKYNTGKVDIKGNIIYNTNKSSYFRNMSQCVDKYYKLRMKDLVSKKDYQLDEFIKSVKELKTEVNLLISKISELETMK